MAIYYLRDSKIEENTILVESKLFHHLKNVLRVRRGEELSLFNEGNIFRAIVKDVEKDSLILQIENRLPQKLNKNPFQIAQAAIEKNELELAIKLIVSTGVKKVFVFRGERSDTKITATYIERLNEIALNTAEQSEVCLVPEIEYFEKVEDLLNSNELKENLFSLSPNGAYSLKDVANAMKENSEITFFIGPEGGFSEKEINILKDKNAREVAIKSGIFRSQFAGVVAVLTTLELIALQD